MKSGFIFPIPLTKNLHLRRRILRLIALEHDSTVLRGNEHLIPTDAGMVGRMIPPDMPARHLLEHAAARPCRVGL